MLTTQAFNALLKTLEEPPPYIVFILSTTEFHKLPATIVSRCQHFDFRRIPYRLILEHLRKIADEEKLEVEDSSLALIATAAEGSLRDAQRSFDQIISFSGQKILFDDVVNMLGIISHQMLLSTTQAIIGQKSAELIRIIDQLMAYGYEPHQICNQLIGHLRNLLLFKVVEEPEEMISLPKEEYEKLKNQAASLTQPEIMRLLDMLLQEEKEVRYSSQARFQLESLLIKMALLNRLLPVETLITKIDHLEEMLKSSTQWNAEEQRSVDEALPHPEPELSQAPIPESPAMEEIPPESDSSKPMEPGFEENKAQYQVPPQDKPLKEQILCAIKEAKPPLFHLLNFASSIKLKNSTLILSFNKENSTHKELLEDKSNLESLKQIASQIADRNIAVKIISPKPEEEEDKDVSGENSAESKRKELEKRAFDQPMIKTFLDVFKGKIVEIKDLKEES